MFAMPLAPGHQLGPYEILAQLGEGGMGEVYKARDTRLNREVALKTSKLEFSERFEREARAVAALNHPNICQLYDVGPNYLVMELIESKQLRGPVEPSQAIEFSKQILDALDAAHRKGITHRDLKPANILVTKQGIKLLDFGLAKQHAPISQSDATLTKALTNEGQILGTLRYMSPEQLQAKPADARSDIFAFGCILYELLTGTKAFQANTAAETIAAILTAPPPQVLQETLNRVIKKCLAKDPDDRFQTARDLKYNLTLAPNQQRPHPTPRSHPQLDRPTQVNPTHPHTAPPSTVTTRLPQTQDSSPHSTALPRHQRSADDHHLQSLPATLNAKNTCLGESYSWSR
jgi:serine/threonine protein kinase